MCHYVCISKEIEISFFNFRSSYFFSTSESKRAFVLGPSIINEKSQKIHSNSLKNVYPMCSIVTSPLKVSIARALFVLTRERVNMLIREKKDT